MGGINTRIIIAVLVATNIAILVWHFSTTPDPAKFAERYPLIDPARNFIAQENFIVNIQPLRERLRAMVAGFEAEGMQTSIYIEFLNTGANISINQEKDIWSASLSKVPIAMAVMKKVEDGEWTLTNELVLLEGDRNVSSGSDDKRLFQYPIGTRFTIEKLLEELLVNSDNTAYYILVRNITDADIVKVVEETGLTDLFTDEGKISAKEYSRLIRSLYTASFLSRKGSEKILEWLDEAPFDDFLAASIPDEVPFAHKYGIKNSLNVYADIGIVYLTERPYLITVLVQGNPAKPYEEEQERAATFMREVSKASYEYFSSQ